MKATPSTERASRLSTNMLCLLLLQCIRPFTFSAQGTFRPMVSSRLLMLPDHHVSCPWVEVSGWQTDGRLIGLEKFCQQKLPILFFFFPRKETSTCLFSQTSIYLSFCYKLYKYKLVQACIILLNADHMKNLILQNTLQCVASVLQKDRLSGSNRIKENPSIFYHTSLN